MASSAPLPQSSARSAAAVNRAIRALIRQAGGRLRAEDRAVYERLVKEWVVATARERSLGDVVAAA